MVNSFKICLEEPFGIYSTSIWKKKKEHSCEILNSLPSSFLILFTCSFPSFWMRASTNVGNTKKTHNTTTTTTNPTRQTKMPQQMLNVNRRLAEECNQEWCCKSSLESDHQKFKNFQLFAITVVIAILKCFPSSKETPCC